MSKLPSTIKKLKVNKHLFNDPLTALEKTGINPTELMFYNYERGDLYLREVFEHQDHIEYIKRLGLLKTLGLSHGYYAENQNDDMVFENITHLAAMMVDPTNKCKLDQLLLTYPSLISLTIHESSDPLTASGPCTPKTYPNLRKLSIKSRQLDQKTIDFVRIALPNIKELDLAIHGYYHNDRRLWCFYKGLCDECRYNRNLRPGRSKKPCSLEGDFSINLLGSMLDVLRCQLLGNMDTNSPTHYYILNFKLKRG